MDPLWVVITAAFCAMATGGLVYFIMQSRVEVLMARQREQLAEVRGALGAQKDAMLDTVRYAGESAKRQAMDEFLADIHIEERHYLRTNKAFFITRKSVVRQERIYFRNLPLSNWIEQEMPFEEGADIDELARTMAVFVPGGLLDEAEPKPRRLLRGNM